MDKNMMMKLKEMKDMMGQMMAMMDGMMGGEEEMPMAEKSVPEIMQMQREKK